MHCLHYDDYVVVHHGASIHFANEIQSKMSAISKDWHLKYLIYYHYYASLRVGDDFRSLTTSEVKVSIRGAVDALLYFDLSCS